MKNNKETTLLDSTLNNIGLKDLDKYIRENSEENSLADFFNEYIGAHNLTTSEVIKKSQLSRDYAYAILNGRKSNPTRDRVIALCLAMNMDLSNTQRALKLCNAGILYSKKNRDAAIILCINTKTFDVFKVNEILIQHDLDILQTSKDVMT